ncbi:MAG: hypothetical protein GEU26_16030 [Nitrososphaeraceae archaeon]|nr:hypothetical protein [Nitrososphaeraceae archaeon]
MNTDKHTRVCATCGQGFTRNSSAVRHNNILHSGHAMIVKPYDYIIGRLKGEFLPGDPGIYRSNRRNQTTSSIYNQPIQTKNNERTDSRIHADVSAHELHPPNSINPMSSGRAPYRSSEIPQWAVNQKTPYTSNQLTERELKLNELKVLLYRNFSSLKHSL